MKALVMLSLLFLGVAIVVLGWEEILSDTDEVEAHFQEGTRLLAAGSWYEASREFRFALLSPDSSLLVAAHHNLALAFLHLSLEEKGPMALHWARESVSQGEEALRIQPGLEGSAWNLELALNRARELDETEREKGAGGAQRLLASFRLQEEARLGETLQRRLRESGPGVGSSALEVVPW